MYSTILFDLDGTLTDPGAGITNSVAYALKKFNIEVADKTALYSFIGPPLLESFEKIYGFSKEESQTAVGYYREYYRERGIFENSLYGGIKDLLIKLKAANKTLIVATSKPEVFAKQILEYFDISGYFSYIAGGNLDGTRTVKAEVITYALNSCKITDKSSAVMVGDREHDIIGASHTGLASVGVLFGYGSYAELKSAGATHIAKDVAALEKILLAG